MKNVKRLIFRLLPVALLLTAVPEASASAKAGEATVNVGETASITLADVYQRTLRKSTGISYRWTSSTTDISVTSSTMFSATIKGNAATTSGKVYYYCSYYIDGFYRTMDFYYEVVVKNSIVYVTGISLSNSRLSLVEGNSATLTATVSPSNATNRNVSWTSSSSSVASVNSYGLVTGKSSGTATITCRASDGSGKYATCDVTVSAATPTSVSLPSTLKLKEGESTTLTPTLSPSGTSTTYTWKSDNTEVASVSQAGKVTANSAGTARITVRTANGLSDYCNVTVTPLPKSVSLTENSVELKMHKTCQLTPIVYPSDAETSYTWTSSDSKVAKVNGNGLVTATGPGEAVVTVRTANGLQAECRVTVPEPEYYFVVWTKNGGTISYPLSERPEVTQSGDKLVVTTTTAAVDYPKTGVVKFTLTDEGGAPSGVESVSADSKAGAFTRHGDVVELSGFRPGSVVGVYTVGGQTVTSGRVGGDGAYSLDLSGLGAGIYIVSTESITFKIKK